MGFFSALFGKGELSEKGKFETLRDDGVRAMQMGELPYAEKCLLAALELQDDLRTKGILAEVALRMQQYDKALPLLRELNAQGDDLELELLQAQTEGRLSDFEAEQATCEKALEKHAGEPRALYLLAEAENGLHNPFPAIAHLTQCLVARPDYQAAMLLRAKILMDMGQNSEALADADALVDADKENEEYLLLRARLLSALGRTEEAEADYHSLRELNPFGTDCVLGLGELYEQTARWDKALALYDEAIELMPSFAEAYKRRGGVKHHLKDDAGAADDLKRSLELAPESAAELDGSYSNVENKMNERYRSMNPYGF